MMNKKRGRGEQEVVGVFCFLRCGSMEQQNEEGSGGSGGLVEVSQFSRVLSLIFFTV